MSCGCNKTKTVQAPPTPGATAAVAAARAAQSVLVYDVFDGTGALVASFSNPVMARAEARRVTGGTTVPRTTTTPTSATVAEPTINMEG